MMKDEQCNFYGSANPIRRVGSESVQCYRQSFFKSGVYGRSGRLNTLEEVMDVAASTGSNSDVLEVTAQESNEGFEQPP